MKRFLPSAVVVMAVLASCGAGLAASVTNDDAEPLVLTVTEKAVRMEVTVEPGVTERFCPSGCFISWGDGERAALSGDEVLTIRGGAVRFSEGD